MKIIASITSPVREKPESNTVEHLETYLESFPSKTAAALAFKCYDFAMLSGYPVDEAKVIADFCLHHFEDMGTLLGQRIIEDWKLFSNVEVAV